MNLQSLLSQFTGSANPDNRNSGSLTNKLGQVGSMIPGGLAGGAMAGGIVAMIVGNKSARKLAGSAATYGGAALLGGLAYKAYKNWQRASQDGSPVSENSFTSAEIMSPDYQMTLIKAMIACARADGHIDGTEQQQIFDAIDKMELSTDQKALMFDLLRRPISIDELAQGATGMEQKTELYLVSCLVADPAQTADRAHLAALADKLQLPAELAQQLQAQAQETLRAA